MRVALAIACLLGVTSAIATPRTAAAATDADATPLGAAFAAYERGDLAAAEAALARGDGAILNADYALYLRGSIALLQGDAAAARVAFTRLATMPSSRFAEQAAWRAADALWLSPSPDDKRLAAKEYATLKKRRGPPPAQIDLAVIEHRLLSLAPPAQQVARLRQLLIASPGHPLESQFIADLRRVAPRQPLLAPAQQLDRIAQLAAQRDWVVAMSELAALPAALPKPLALRAQFLTGDTLFRMRKRYEEAGRLLLAIYDQLGADAPRAMFRGARALSRADRDDEAISHYLALVAKYPRSEQAHEAFFLAGWLEFNRGNYALAAPRLAAMIAKYPGSEWRGEAEWFLAYSHYLLAQYDLAIAALARLARSDEEQIGGKARYWTARAHALRGDKAAAIAGYKDVVNTWPLTWYATLARTRLAEFTIAMPPLGEAPRTATGPLIEPGDPLVLPEVVADPLIMRVRELQAAGLPRDAGIELQRGESALRKRFAAPRAWAILHALYPALDHPGRLFKLATSYHGGALRAAPTGNARRWWEAAFPRAFAGVIATRGHLGAAPPEFIFAIMRVESGYDPHVVSFADAQGLLQMIPPTTTRVAGSLGLSYGEGDLFDVAFNIETGSWYIGGLFEKFARQVPIAAASFNAGPVAMMRWLNAPHMNTRPLDEFVELVSFRETREYMKRVTTHYIRYQFLYHDAVYEQPLTLQRGYRADDLNY
ncbi:MAG: transglycosylase SLT domain-containing protein [Myxococcales bacterium]|nr:transglycosylase SLT domain-containing protein [Myxococcales bacterium]